MTRRDLLKAGIALGAAGSAIAFADDKVRRVGIIGPGWYGKSDLLRMVQVSPIEVVSMCDVDSKMPIWSPPAKGRRKSRGLSPIIARC
jgi:hypothetical protein